MFAGRNPILTVLAVTPLSDAIRVTAPAAPPPPPPPGVPVEGVVPGCEARVPPIDAVGEPAAPDVVASAGVVDAVSPGAATVSPGAVAPLAVDVTRWARLPEPGRMATD